jgi:hypothetical protein
MAWPKGQPKAPTSGRKKGTPNRIPSLLKDCIIRAAEIAGGGGEDGLLKYLVKQANENPAGYLTLLGRIVPMQVGADPDSDQLVVFVNRYVGADGLVTARDRDGNLVDDPCPDPDPIWPPRLINHKP